MLYSVLDRTKELRILVKKVVIVIYFCTGLCTVEPFELEWLELFLITNTGSRGWLRKLAIWQCVTDLEPKKLGPVVYLSQSDKTRKSCNYVSVQDLNKDDGLNVIIKKIRSLYAKDMKALDFMAYDKFENFRRSDDMNIIDYINEFEQLNNQIKHFEIELLAGVLASKVLKNVDLSNEKVINSNHSSASHI